MAARLGRKRPVPARPNAALERCLRAWRDEAAARGSKARFAYERALVSLRRYPLPLRSGREASILQHFGPGLCRRLDQHLRGEDAPMEAAEGPAPPPVPEPQGPAPPTSAGDPPPPPPQKRPRAPRGYLPGPRSGGHALLLALYKERQTPGGRGALTKAELQRAAQPLCDQPLAPTGGRSGAWATVSTLIRRNLVLKAGVPPRYSLTPQGLELAQRLVGGPETQTPLDSEDEEENQPPEPVWPAGGRKQALLEALVRGAVPYDVRKLHVADFVWVARERQPHGVGPLRELVLDYAVERKRMADLCSSIMDGRFREQKFRLRRCGLRCPIYLVEEAGAATQCLPESSLRQAAVSTQVVDGFFVKYTQDLRETAAYLTLLTRHLARLYGPKTLVSRREEAAPGPPPPPLTDPIALLPFTSFNQMAAKNQAQTVQGVFARQLMQISGVSGERAAAILQRYPTPTSLREAYATCPDTRSREQLLSGIKCGKLKRNLGPALSRTLSQLYCTPGPLP
ncbi:crossover junction endonuclease MUS81 isoform X2 [Alligator mississippiensis]|nr:crossover junction endonuclease MUS81 isoform X2 [Alligator mississippiensis]